MHMKEQNINLILVREVLNVLEIQEMCVHQILQMRRLQALCVYELSKNIIIKVWRCEGIKL